MIPMEMPPSVARFPCSVEVSIDAPGWEREITAALGIYSQLSGTTFTAGNGGIHFVVKTYVNGTSGADYGQWQGDTVTLAPAMMLNHNGRLKVALHELGHAYWQGHNTEKDSIMNPNYWGHKLSERDAAIIKNNGCKVY